tara:strand:+ start:4574 stop:5905 length:1332 start_codon:yes stop_codon:yes gene_type:complete
MEDLTYKYTLILYIHAPNDSNQRYTQTLSLSSSYPIMNSKGKITLEISRPRAGYKAKGEPVINGLSSAISAKFGWGRRTQRQYNRLHSYSSYEPAPDNFDIMFELGNEEKGYVLVSRQKPHYKLMGLRTEKKNMATALSRVLYRSCFEENGKVLGNYLMNMVTLPENVSYALENRAPYDFFHDGKRIESRLNVKRISDQECAMEISDGIWGPISVKEMDRFMNSYHHGHTRSKRWNMCSPKRLWWELMGEHPSETQLKLMYGFLSQNRTDDIVEQRAKKLMEDIQEKYSDRIKIISDVGEDDKPITRMYVKGVIADWLIIDKTWKTNVQKVKTFVFRNEENRDKTTRYRRNQKLEEYQNGWWSGPICIDNIHNNSSVGDQFVARAMALLNDKQTVKLVSTISSYLDASMLDGTYPQRINWDGVGNEEEMFWTELDYLEMLGAI